MLRDRKQWTIKLEDIMAGEAKAFEFSIKVMLSGVDWGAEEVPTEVKDIRDDVVTELIDLEQRIRATYPGFKPRFEIEERLL
jgi:hypothetical protein